MRLRIGSYPRAVRSFFAQSGNVYPNRIAEIVHAVIPNMVNKLFLTYGTPLMQQQVFKNRRLFSGKRQLQSVGGGYACFGVEGNAARSFRTTSFCVNCRLVRLRILASSSSK